MQDSKVFTTVNSVRERLRKADRKKNIAIVPTMGALHHGHIELVKQAFDIASTVVVSIFVNPMQFNSSGDLDAYPRTFEEDVRMLNEVGDVVIFAPSVEDVYPTDYEEINLDLGLLELVMEGKFRPGHFKGVVNVVKRLFDVVEPTHALFGEKDFQQLAVIRFMAEELDVPVEIIGCETVRETSGLASSSRNRRLNEAELVESEIIIRTMEYVQSLVSEKSPNEAIELARNFFQESSLELEYMQIVNPESLEDIQTWVPGARICMAAFCGEVRLIDNMELISADTNSDK